MVEEISLTKHRIISQIQLQEICELKAMRWNYSLHEHLKWMDKNIKPEDYHIMISQDQKLIAYANLVNTLASINGEITDFKGIGNVCTSESGMGYGNILMNAINKSLFENKWKGILLCKDHLVAYYQKFGWTLVKEKDLLFPIGNNVYFMIFNHKMQVHSFEFKGENF